MMPPIHSALRRVVSLASTATRVRSFRIPRIAQGTAQLRLPRRHCGAAPSTPRLVLARRDRERRDDSDSRPNERRCLQDRIHRLLREHAVRRARVLPAVLHRGAAMVLDRTDPPLRSRPLSKMRLPADLDANEPGTGAVPRVRRGHRGADTRPAHFHRGLRRQLPTRPTMRQ